MKTPIRLIIADDHTLFRESLCSALRLRPEVRVVAEVAQAADLLSALAEAPCDVLLLDLQMDRWLIAEIESLSHLTRVVVLTASERVEDGLAALRRGARAVVQKRFAIETLMDAIRAVGDGLVWMPPELQAALAARVDGSDTPRLTPRESEIARRVALGLRNAEIGAKLSITEATVKAHLNKIFQKLGLRDRVELARYAFRIGLVSPRDETR